MNNYVGDYDSFYYTFLEEMPQKMPGNNDFTAQLEMLQENIHLDSDKVLAVNSDVFKIEIDNQTTYWVGTLDASSVSLIVDTETMGKYCKIILSSKNPSIPAGNPPYASELYLLISKDMANQHITFTSDETISSDAERLWLRLLSQGKKISVYDKEAHKYILQPINGKEDMIKYIGGPDKKKYVFVLSETLEKQRGIMHSFGIMEIKRLANWPLFDHLTPEKGLSDE